MRHRIRKSTGDHRPRQTHQVFPNRPIPALKIHFARRSNPGVRQSTRTDTARGAYPAPRLKPLRAARCLPEHHHNQEATVRFLRLHSIRKNQRLRACVLILRFS